jgi:hypothetical protein
MASLRISEYGIGKCRAAEGSAEKIGEAGFLPVTSLLTDYPKDP